MIEIERKGMTHLDQHPEVTDVRTSGVDQLGERIEPPDVVLQPSFPVGFLLPFSLFLRVRGLLLHLHLDVVQLEFGPAPPHSCYIHTGTRTRIRFRASRDPDSVDSLLAFGLDRAFAVSVGWCWSWCCDGLVRVRLAGGYHLVGLGVRGRRGLGSGG